MLSLLKPDVKLFPFQQEHVDLARESANVLMVWDCGVGKSVGALALAAHRLDEGVVDHVFLICEKSKLIEWGEEIGKFTTIEWGLYAGTIKQRERIRNNLKPLMLASFDIVKNDAAISRRNDRGNKMAPIPGPLSEALHGKRVMVIYDETARLANRSSDTHKHHEVFLNSLRDTPGFYLLSLTATPMERDPESFYNLIRLISPETAGTVSEFEQQYVAGYNVFQKPNRFMNLSIESCNAGVTPLKDRMGALMLRKRKTDPDVAKFFPEKREMPPIFVSMGDLQQKFYNTVEGIAEGLSDWEARPYLTVLRQIAADPRALLLSEGQIAKAIVDTVTPEGIRGIGSAKTQTLLDWTNTIVRDGGEQVVIFTFYAQSVLPILQQELENAGYSVSINHGGLSDATASQMQRDFRSGKTQIFLSGDKGARGINLPEGSSLLHYERPTIHTTFIQRSDRIHRINSTHESIFIYSFIMRHSIEEAFADLSLRRNSWADLLSGDEDVDDSDFISADDRKALLRLGRQQQGR